MKTGYLFVTFIMFPLLPVVSSGQSLMPVPHSFIAPSGPKVDVPRQLSLDKAEEILLLNNLALTAARYGIDIARAQRLTASLRPNPTLTFGAEQFDIGHFRHDLFSTNPDAAANRFYTFRYDQILERGNKRKLRTEVAESQLQAAEAQLLDATRQQLFQLKQVFYTAVLARENLRVADENLYLINSTEQMIKLHVDTGDTAEWELIKFQTNKMQYQRDLLAAHVGADRLAAIGIFLHGRDMGSVVADAQRAVREKVKLPEGYYITWGGEFENQQRAMSRLKIIVPVSVFLIFLLLFNAFKSVKDAVLILLNVPFAVVGGIFALIVTGIPLSVSAAVGFIALFGQAVLNGVVMVTYFKQLRARGLSVWRAVHEGALIRLRTVLMTALLASLGLLPAALSTGIGSETQKPLAIVIIGGLISATVLTLIVLPALYLMFNPVKNDLDDSDGAYRADEITDQMQSEAQAPTV